MQVLVLETCSGLVTGAVAERLGGFGHVCTTYVGDKCPPLEATRMLNFPDSIRDSMSTASLATLLQYQGEQAADGAAQGPEEGDKVQGGLLEEARQRVLQSALMSPESGLHTLASPTPTSLILLALCRFCLLRSGCVHVCMIALHESNLTSSAFTL